jgi:hypothetical protein
METVGPAMGDDLTAWLRLEPGDLLSRVTAGDPGLGPVGGLQRSGEDHLGNVVHRSRERHVSLGPELSHALLGNPAHDVAASLAQQADEIQRQQDTPHHCLQRLGLHEPRPDVQR